MVIKYHQPEIPRSRVRFTKETIDGHMIGIITTIMPIIMSSSVRGFVKTAYTIPAIVPYTAQYRTNSQYCLRLIVPNVIPVKYVLKKLDIAILRKTVSD